MNKVGIHELMIIEREEKTQREREKTDRAGETGQGAGKNRDDIVFLYNRIPTNKYRRKAGIRKFGNLHSNNKHNREVPMDAKASE